MTLGVSRVILFHNGIRLWRGKNRAGVPSSRNGLRFGKWIVGGVEGGILSFILRVHDILLLFVPRYSYRTTGTEMNFGVRLSKHNAMQMIGRRGVESFGLGDD